MRHPCPIWSRSVATLTLSAGTLAALAGPETQPYLGLQGETVGAAALSGWYATASTTSDTIEFRDIRGSLMNSFDRAFLQSRLPWMRLDSSTDGPSAITFSDSGRLAFVMIHDDQAPGDAILRFDTDTWDVDLFVSSEFSNQTSAPAGTALAFYDGRLLVGDNAGMLRVYRAQRNDTTGSLLNTVAAGSPITALAVDRDTLQLFVGTENAIFETDAPAASSGLTFRANAPGLTGLAHSPHFGFTFPLAGGPGLYALDTAGQVSLVSGSSLQPYTSFSAPSTDLAATADGRLLASTVAETSWIAESLDGRLSFEEWVQDEFDQVLSYAKGLISPDGEPAGWVIDADVLAGNSRFHPATPDAACWALLLLMVAEEVNNDPEAKPLVTEIMTRYAGLADGARPGWSDDGHIRHWGDPFSTTGQNKPGWPDEFAMYSTMKMVLGASRVAQRYPNDPAIREAAAAILAQTSPTDTFDAYIQPGSFAVSLVSLGSSPNTAVANPPFAEAIVFVDQAADLGTAASQAGFNAWIDRNTSPSATYLDNRPVSVISPNNFMASFVSLYPMLVVDEFRNDASWQNHIRDLLASQAAWTDDNAPRYFTVFSAGSTKGEFGGYRADSLTSHPGDFTTFPSLLAFAGTGRTDVAVAAYQAYRRGARADWETGASFLYRRSDQDLDFLPDSAGLPDVGIGALGLAELLQPGVIDLVLSGGYERLSACQADLNGDGIADNGDIGAFVQLFLAQDFAADFNGDNVLDNGDIGAFISAFLAGC